MYADTTLHFDISSGIAGDMALGVLYGLGLELSEVSDIVCRMTGQKINIRPEKVYVNGIASTRLNINMPHEHSHRTLADIREMILSAELPGKTAEDAVGIFSIIAEAEGAVHGKSPEEVHFHEVGALDSILDIVGFAYGVHRLGIKKISSSRPVLGCGFVKCAHGKVPVPAPATLKILEGVDVLRTEEPNELTTPTGAAILKYYVKDFSAGYEGKISGSAYSTGTLTLKTMPNILRGTLIESAAEKQQITVIETNIDDCSPEIIGGLHEKLKNLCLDFFTTAVSGKKNRQGVLLTILCKNEYAEKTAEILFAETTTAGVRYYKTDRIIMRREMVTVYVDNEPVKLKKLWYKDIVKYVPEWDDCAEASKKLNQPVMKVYSKAVSLGLDL